MNDKYDVLIVKKRNKYTLSILLFNLYVDNQHLVWYLNK